jgi:hypothetical protein
MLSNVFFHLFLSQSLSVSAKVVTESDQKLSKVDPSSVCHFIY